MNKNTKQYRKLPGGLLGVVAAVALVPAAVAQTPATPTQPADAPTNPLGTSGGVAPNAASVPTPRAQTSVAAAKTGAATLPAITATPGSAEEVAQLRELVIALSNRLQSLEDEQLKTAAAVSRPQVGTGSKLPITFSGLLQVQGLATTSQEGPDSLSNDTFRLRRGELKIVGRVNEKITGTAMFDIAKTQDSNDRPADEILQEIFLTYRLNENKARGTSSFIDIGQFKIPVGYEGDLVSSSALQTVERALMYQNRDPFRGGYGDKRETGVQFRGTAGQFRYWIGAFNGLGERQNTTSARDNKSVLARLIFSPKSVRGLQLGVSGGIGNTGNPTSANPRLDRTVLNTFVAYKRDRLTAQAEYMTADAQTTAETGVRDVRSYYGSLGYLFTKKLEGVVRYDVFDFFRGASGGDVSEATLGVNYYIKGNNAKIQANIVRRDGDELAPSGFRNDSTQLRTNFQVAF